MSVNLLLGERIVYIVQKNLYINLITVISLLPQWGATSRFVEEPTNENPFNLGSQELKKKKIALFLSPFVKNITHKTTEQEWK